MSRVSRRSITFESNGRIGINIDDDEGIRVRLLDLFGVLEDGNGRYVREKKEISQLFTRLK